MNLKVYDKDYFQSDRLILTPNVDLDAIHLDIRLEFDYYAITSFMKKDTRNYEEKISRYSLMIFVIAMLSFSGLLNIIKGVFQNEAEGNKVILINLVIFLINFNQFLSIC